MIKKIFVTGTDTSVGKTIVSSILLKKANKLGYRTAGYKPISSGAKKEKIKNKNEKYQFINQDAVILQKNSSITLDIKEVNPIVLFENVPPHIISSIENKTIQKKDLSLGLYNLIQKSNWILIEGAGGWYTPLSEKVLFSDWVREEKLEIIFVVGIKLGCINHAILTEKAILSEQLICLGWIANNVLPPNKYTPYYIQTLLSYIKSPFLGMIPYLKDKNKINIKKIKIPFLE